MATIEKLEHDQVKLTIEIDADTFNAALQQAYVKNGKHYNIAGFRKGKAPRKVIESMYGEGVFFEDAFELCWGDAYDAALEENGLTAVDKPTLDIEKIGKDEGVVFTAVVQLKPTVKLGAYKGIEVEHPTYTVEDADVNAEIEKEREKNARFVDVERAVENGDRVVIDYSGSVDGVQFDGGTAEEQTLVIGSNTFIPGFEEQLIGMNVGEELPELDDEFAKDVSEFDTLAELIADKRKKMEEQAAKNEKIAIENIALKTVCDNAEVEVPECMTERQANYMLRDMGYRLQMSGISLEDYCRYVGTDLNALKASYHDEAASRVKMQLVIEAVGKAENVTCTDEEIAEVIKEYAENNDMPVEEFEKQISDDDREFLSDRKIAEKTVALIVDNVKLVPAKKTEEK